MRHKIAARLRKKHGLRYYLLALIVAIIIPASVVVGLAVWQAGSTLRATSTDLLMAGAQTITNATESEISLITSLLTDLAALPGDSETLKTRIAQYNEEYHNQGSTLSILAGKDWVGKNQAALPAPKETLARAIASKKPALSNLYHPAGSDILHIAMVVHAPSRTDENRLLLLSITPERRIQILEHLKHRSDDLLVAVTDGNGHIMARSRSPDRYIGVRVPGWDKLTSIGGNSGNFETITTEGKPIMFAFNKLPNTPGWTLVIGEPLRNFDSRWKSPLYVVIGAAIISLLLAVIAISWIAGQVLRPVMALADQARLVASNRQSKEPFHSPPSAVKEFEALRLALLDAEKTLRNQAIAERKVSRTLAISERRYKAMAEIGALVFWRRDLDGEVTSADGWQELTGLPVEEALGRGWLNSLHPDDIAESMQRWEKAKTLNEPMDAEFRIMAATGHWHWVRCRGAPVRDEQGNLCEWCGVLEDVNERHVAQDRIAHMAHHDGLTNLPNRLKFSQELNKTIEAHKQGELVGGAVLYLDLDRFKEVNDTLGHPAGDRLLKAVTERLRRNLKQGDVIARMGGDEFAIIQPHGIQPDSASALARRIIDKLSTPYNLDGHRAVIGVSVGIAYIEGKGESADTLVRRADMALYCAKEEGRQQFRFFDAAMDAHMDERRQLETELRRALAAGEFTILYQPRYSTKDRQLVACEALLRWNHPERGTLTPDHFLALIEETGLILPLGRQILMQACKDAMQWPDEYRVAVNISPAQLSRSGLADTVERILDETGLPAKRLELEITEEALIRAPDTAVRTLRQLKKRGVRLVVDNFGTGCSSIGHLRDFPFDKVNIDGSFIKTIDIDPDSRPVIDAISNLCDKLGVEVAAIGVETEAQLDYLKQCSAVEVQGYYFAQPLPMISITQIEALSAAEMKGTQPAPQS